MAKDAPNSDKMKTWSGEVQSWKEEGRMEVED
jgi:hypothetical protein